MPELPEVETAVRRIRRLAAGRTITSVRVLHPAYRRRLPRAAARALAGDRVTAVSRYAKTQSIHLTSGRLLEVQFRMTGDWVACRSGDVFPPHARLALMLDDGVALVLDDPRALAVVRLHEAPAPVTSAPDALSPSFDEDWLASALASRRAAVKAALLDQRVAPGVGNIYASEALWHAGINPRTPARGIGRIRVARLVAALRLVLRRGLRTGVRYYRTGSARTATSRFAVYDREGESCVRCGAPIRRIVLAGRGTYFCPRCQRR